MTFNSFMSVGTKNVIDKNKNLRVKVKRPLVKVAGLFSAYGLLLPPGGNQLSQLCVKSKNSIAL